MATSALKPVVKLSAETQTLENLRNYLLSGAVKPGARLTEMSLAEQLGVARATLRASLNRLVTEGIVVLTPYTGWRVAALTEGDAWELWTLRASLEGLAAKLAAESMSPDRRTRIGQAMASLVVACGDGDVRSASDADFALHRTIVESIGHSRLERQYLQVEQQIRLYIMTSNALVGDLGQIVSQHEPLVEALLRADPELAAREAWIHNETEGRKLANWLHEQETDRFRAPVKKRAMKPKGRHMA